MREAQIHEIAPDLFRLSIYVRELDMQFNHFLVRDEEPLLFHTGLKRTFPMLREAVCKLIDATTLRHIAWSHFESDECGALNDWLQLAPQAQPVCTIIGKLSSYQGQGHRLLTDLAGVIRDEFDEAPQR